MTLSAEVEVIGCSFDGNVTTIDAAARVPAGNTDVQSRDLSLGRISSNTEGNVVLVEVHFVVEGNRGLEVGAKLYVTTHWDGVLRPSGVGSSTLSGPVVAEGGSGFSQGEQTEA